MQFLWFFFHEELDIINMLVNYYFYSCNGYSAHFLTMVIPIILVIYRSIFKESVEGNFVCPKMKTLLKH